METANRTGLCERRNSRLRLLTTRSKGGGGIRFPKYIFQSLAASLIQLRFICNISNGKWVDFLVKTAEQRVFHSTDLLKVTGGRTREKLAVLRRWDHIDCNFSISCHFSRSINEHLEGSVTLILLGTTAAAVPAELLHLPNPSEWCRDP